MYCLGERRRETFWPALRRSRSRWRIFSRSIATAFMRLPRLSPANSGMASVITVDAAAMAANSIARNRVSAIFSIRKSIMTRALEIEVDHLLHHEHADRHPHRAAHQ